MTVADFRLDRSSGYRELSEHLGPFVGHVDQGRRTAYYSGYARARAFASEALEKAREDVETHWGRARLVAEARRERDAMRERAIAAEAKLKAVEAQLDRYQTVYGGMRQMRYIITDVRKALA